MLAGEVAKLEQENHALRKMVHELSEQLENGGRGNPRVCKYCKNYIQHYGLLGGQYKELNAGHCISGVPVKKGGKRNPTPEEYCMYFELIKL